jgi:hypothetical protein
MGLDRRLGHELHRQVLLVDERVQHRRRKRGERALVGQRRQDYLRRLGRQRRQPGIELRLRDCHELRRHLASREYGGLPNRYIAGVTVDPSNPAHAYAVFNGYSRRWIAGGGVGRVFETLNGGASWTDISGNLPDIACDAVVLSHGRLALATDAGAFTAAEGQGASTAWSRLGSGLANASVNDLTVGPNGYMYAGTHGRGIWRISF